MTILPDITDEDLTCWQCACLGIPTPTIIAGHPFFRVYVDGRPLELACCDCVDRLQQELKSAEADE